MALQQRAPAAVAELGRPRGRPDDVGEEHGREHAVADGRGPRAREELLDLVGEPVVEAEPGGLRGRELDVRGARDVLGDVARVTLVEVRIVGAAHDERRALDARQQLPHVHLADRSQRRGGGGRVHRQALEAPQQRPERGIGAGRHGTTADPASPCPSTRRRAPPSRPAPRDWAPTRSPARARGGAAATASPAPAPRPGARRRTWRRGRSPRRSRGARAAATRRPPSRRARRPPAPRTGRRRRRRRTSPSRAGRTAIRRANAASRLQEPGQPRHLPRDLDVRQEGRDEQEVQRALADHLVGDPQVTAACVPRRGSVHAADPSHGTRPGPGLRRPVPGRGRSVADRA